MAPLNLGFQVLLLTSIASSASAFFLPSSSTNHELKLRSSPNAPDDWFQTESSNKKKGMSIEPMSEAFIDPYGNPSTGGHQGMNKAGILQQQNQPTTVRFGGVRGKQPQKQQQQQQQRRQGGDSYYPTKAAAASSRRQAASNINNAQQSRAAAPRAAAQQSRAAPTPRDSPTNGVAERKPKLDFQQARQAWKGTAPADPISSDKRDTVRDRRSFQQEGPDLSAYEQWKTGDNRPQASSYSAAPKRERQPQRPQQQGPPPSWAPQDTPPSQYGSFEGTRTNGFHREPNQPGTFVQSDRPQAFAHENAADSNWPNERTQNRDVPFEGRLTRKFSSTPDQPGAWFQKNDLADGGDVMPPPQQQNQQRPPPPPEREYRPTPYQQQRQQQQARERKPNMPTRSEPVTSFHQERQQQPRRSEQPQAQQQQPRRPQAQGEVRRPVLPNMPANSQSRQSTPRADNTRREESRGQQQRPVQQRQPNMPNRPQQPQPRERKPNIPKMTTSGTGRGKQQIVERPLSSTGGGPGGAFQVMEPPPMRTGPGVRERPPMMQEPQPRGSTTGAIMPLEPLVGGPLSPAAFSFDSPVLGSGNGGRKYYDQFRAPDEVIQGAGSRKTWETSHHDQTILEIGSEGRPVMATAQVWQGPGNTPASMTMYSEDGAFRPWKAAFQNTGGSSVLDVQNTGPMEFPLDASVVGKHDGSKGVGKLEKDAVDYQYTGPSKFKVTQTVQGQSLKYFNIKRGVAAIHVELFSEGRPMFVQVELWQGPNAVKQCAEIYSDNGNDRHWSAIIDTHGQECVIAVRNVGPALVYPINASVDPIMPH